VGLEIGELTETLGPKLDGLARLDIQAVREHVRFSLCRRLRRRMDQSGRGTGHRTTDQVISGRTGVLDDHVAGSGPGAFRRD
jgi:hypothetical protein